MAAVTDASTSGRTHRVTLRGKVDTAASLRDLTNIVSFSTLSPAGGPVNRYGSMARLDLVRGASGARTVQLGEHLVRLGTRDELVVAWQRSDGTAGTVQRKTEDDATG